MDNNLFFRDESFRFDISISDKCYDHKPTSEDYKGMSFSLVVGITVEELLDFIKKGHSFCHVFDENIRKKVNFLYTYSVFVDVDNSNESMFDFINQCAIEPTLAYTTSSNGLKGKGFRYRLIYIFDGIIDNEATYKCLYNSIADKNGLRDTKDNCGSVSNQLMNGNSKDDIEIYCSHYIYHINASFFSKCSLEYTTSLSPHYYSKEQFEKNETAPDLESIIVGNDSDEVDKMIDLFLKDTKAFLSIYEGKIDIISESKIDFNEEGYGFYPEDYFCLFYRYNWQEKKVIKFKDHEKRRNRLYIDTCIMRMIKPDATFQELLYNLVVRRQRYYDNSDGVLNNRFLVEKVCQVFGMNL